MTKQKVFVVVVVVVVVVFVFVFVSSKSSNRFIPVIPKCICFTCMLHGQELLVHMSQLSSEEVGTEVGLWPAVVSSSCFQLRVCTASQ